MTSRLVSIIRATDPGLRDTCLAEAVRDHDEEGLLAECAALEALRRESDNLYERVRALAFLHALHRFHLPARYPASAPPGKIPYAGHEHLLHRRFEEAIDCFLDVVRRDGAGDAISSALAAAYHQLAFQTLADQVRRSVRSVPGNQWMFRTGHTLDHPLRIVPRLLEEDEEGTCPMLWERTPVRMDLSHCGWSDIFFLGMDYPEGARVLNISVDLGVHGRDAAPRPPVEAYLRVIDRPVLRLTSVDLGASAEVEDLAEVFDFARDYLGLLKAAVIAAGVIPPGMEGSGLALSGLLARLCGRGRGLEIVSRVNDIPKGSRLAVSTNLLAALIAVCMRATGQTRHLTGPLEENERRVVLARALLGEWLGGSGGGWQDSGGVWPGIKLITGVAAGPGDAESGISRGRLMPRHEILGAEDCPEESRRRLQESLVLVHGGMAQNVGPILEMVTEKYLLRSGAEWEARREALGVLDEILVALREGDVRRIGERTTFNFRGPLQAIIPWATNAFTEQLIERVADEFGPDFWGFWMLGGMSGGGMGFIFAPERKAEARERLGAIMGEVKAGLETGLPFAMEPVVYDFAINEDGTRAELLEGERALMPAGYYRLAIPPLLRQPPQALRPLQRADLDRFARACRERPGFEGMVRQMFDVIFPRIEGADASGAGIHELLGQIGFDREQHEAIRADLRDGRIGLAQNRLRSDTVIEDVSPAEVIDARRDDEGARERGAAVLRRGGVAVVTLAAGAGSRWTQGAGVVKALHPFARIDGRHRTFVETHLAKSRRTGREFGAFPAHVFTTSYLTHSPIERALAAASDHDYPGEVILSPGRSVGLRMVPMVRDLRFAWERVPQQVLDEQQQKVRESLRAALIQWAEGEGEGSDYTDNLPLQCLHPVGHWFEVPNLLLNGRLADLLARHPALDYLLLHNIDTLGAHLDPSVLGRHIESGATLSFEVIQRRIEDRGGGLARVNGRPRLVEGLAMPDEKVDFDLSFYNSLTTWITIDALLADFGLDREGLRDRARVAAAVRGFASRMPTYVTLKDVKKRWGHGQEDVFPVAQFEKLWGDMSALPDVEARFLLVTRQRGQQLKDQSQLDGWLRDGSAAAVAALADWE